MKKKVVIIGGGFGGLQLAKHLDKKLFDVLLIDQNNHHKFQPLLYQVATSQLEPSSISFPFRNVFPNGYSVKIRMAKVNQIDPENKIVITSAGEFPYDFLVMANGCKTNFFNNAQIAQNAFPLKSVQDATSIRNHILELFERTFSASEKEIQSLMNLVIVGGGPTGVELAGAFAEIKRKILPKDYPDIDFSNFTIYLVEGGKSTLSGMSPKARDASARYLKKLGVNIITQTLVLNYDGTTVELSNGQSIQSKTVIWAAGVIGIRIPGLSQEAWTPMNRVKVNRFNQVEEYGNIFAVGDIAYMTTKKYPKGHPQVANVAINQAKLLAKNLKKLVKDQKLSKYEYRNLGTMATIGKNKAVVDLPFIRFKGYPAWVVWMFLHLMLILSVRNKLIIFINWAWAYMSTDSSLRIILR